MRTLLHIGLVIAGFALGFSMINQLQNSLAAFTWVATDCVIQQSQVLHSEQNDPPCSLAVAFSYKMDEKSYIGRTWRLDPGDSSNWCSDLATIAGEFAPRTATTCYVDPQNPARAVLSRGNILSLLSLLIPLLIITVGIVGLNKQAANKLQPTTDSSKAKLICSYVAIVVFIASTAGGIYLGILPIVEVLQARSWVENKCKILSSSLEGSENSPMHQRPVAGSHRRGYQIQIVYSYAIGEQTYITDRFDFVKWGSTDANKLAETTNLYPIGELTTCYVDQSNYYQAVIDRSYGTKYLLGFLPFIFSASAFGLLTVARKLM